MFICNDNGTIYETFMQLETEAPNLRFLCKRVTIGEGEVKVDHRNPELHAVHLYWDPEYEYFMSNELYASWQDVVTSRLPV